MSMNKNKSSSKSLIDINLFAISLCLKSILSVALLSISTVSLAWGPLGHQSICDAAWRASSPQLQNTLGNTAKRMGYNTYAESCMWADDIRRDKSYSWAKPLHYMNLPRKAGSAREGQCKDINSGHKPKCVWSAIQYFHLRWQDVSLSQQQRDEALLLFSHFVADIHQPLHVAYRDDRGGTRQNVTFNGRLMSLHSLWDGQILYCGTRARWRDLGKQLYRRHSRYSQSGGGGVAVWADESFALTRLIYRDLNPRLPKSYCEKFHPLAIVRLELASVRLAGLIKSNEFGGDSGTDKVQSAPNLI